MGEKRKHEETRPRRKDLVDDPTPDQLEEAYEESRKLVALHEDPKYKRDRTQHAHLPGVTKQSGDRIQAIVALRIQGFRDVDIAKHLGTFQPEISRLESNFPDAFAKAEIHALTQAERKYKINMWSVRAALSEAGPKLVNVLIELAENPEVKDNVRKDAAIAGLNLMGVGYTRTTVGGKDSKLNAGAANMFIQAVKDKEQEYQVVDAEDVEYVEEENS